MAKYKLTNGQVLMVVEDRDPQSPDTWENEDMFLVYNHRQFSVKREGFEPEDIFQYMQDAGVEDNDTYDDYYIYQVNAYIHSGISLSLGDLYPFNENNKSSNWDTSTTGYILIKKDSTDTKVYAEGLLKTWNQYLSGYVYGYVLYDVQNTYTITETDLGVLRNDTLGTILTDSFLEIASKDEQYDDVDSCWGFYAESEEDVLNDILKNHLGLELKKE